MSLLHRVSSSDSLARRPSAALEDDNFGRAMSFNPVGEWTPPTGNLDPIGAFEVSKTKRVAQVAAAVVYCLFSAGIVFGYAAIKPVLIAEGVYRDQCTQKEIDDDVEVCYDQEIRLNLMFTIAAVATNVCALPVGTVLDRYGPRVTSLIGCLFIGIGCLLFAFAWDLKPRDGYVPGYLFLALGGPFIYISCFQLSNTFPKYSGLILALVTGAFDTSSAIFLFYRLIYTASDGQFWPKRFFLGYLIFPVMIAVVQITLMPNKSYKTVSEIVKQAEEDTSQDPPPVLTSPNFGSSGGGQTTMQQADDEAERNRQLQAARRERRESVLSELTSLLGTKSVTKKTQREEDMRNISGVWGALHGKSAWQQIQTPWFGLIALFTLLQMLRINYFVATIRPQYTYLLGSLEAAKEINSFFDVALPMGGVIAIPFIGFILDNTSTPFVLGLLVGIATTIGILGVLPYKGAAYANVVLFVLYRPLYYTAVSDYAAKVFGFVTFGKVYGLIICLAGIFNFLQTPLDAATHRTFKNDPVPVNIMLLSIALVVGVVMVVFVWLKSRSLERERLELEAEGASESLMPNHDERVHQDHHPVNVHGLDAAKGGPNKTD